MNRTVYSLLTLLGAVLLVAGGMMYVATREAGVGTWVPLAVGIVLTVAGILLNYNEVSRVAGGRSATRAFSALLETVIVVAIVFFIYGIIAHYPGVTKDLTKNQRLSLAGQTISVLRSLDEKDREVRVTSLLTSEQNILAPVEQLLRKYRAISTRFDYKIVDLLKQREAAARFGERAKLGDTYVESGGKREKVELPISEEKLTNAIIAVMSKTVPKVYFTIGHGEYPITESTAGSQDSYTELAGKLREQTYETAELNIAQRGESESAIPADCAALVIGGPVMPFYQPEVDAVRDYLAAGGKALFLLNPPPAPREGEGGKTHDWNPVLSEYGVSVDSAVIIEQNRMALAQGVAGPVQPIVAPAGDSPITRELLGVLVMSRVAPLSVSRAPRKKADVQPILQTGPESLAYGDLAALEKALRASGRVEMNPERDRQGPLTVGVSIEADVTDATPLEPGAKTRLVVIGDSDFLAGNPRANHVNLFRNIIAWLTKSEEHIGIAPRDLADTSLILDPNQKAILTWVPPVVMPGLVLIAALAMLVLRRRFT